MIKKKSVDKIWKESQELQKNIYLQENSFILCDCYSHALQLDFDQEIDDELYLSMWERSPGCFKMALRERLRWIWRILTTGRPFTDQIILSGPKIKLLRDKLNVICDKLDESVKNADKL